MNVCMAMQPGNVLAVAGCIPFTFVYKKIATSKKDAQIYRT
jgi:hypothetical protein